MPLSAVDLLTLRQLAAAQSYKLVRQGNLVTFSKFQKWSPKTPSRKGKALNGFSEGARLRLIKFVATLDWNKIGKCLFVTLTYPDEVSNPDKDLRNRQRYLFMRYVENYVGREINGVWRIEWMARQTGENIGKVCPHFHLMLFGIRFIPKEKIRQWWRNVLHVNGDLATDVRRCGNRKKASIYLTKYTCKRIERATLDNAPYLNTDGRHYGFLRKEQIPLTTPEVFVDLSIDEIRWFQHYATENLPWYGGCSNESFTLFGERGIGLYEDFLRSRLTNDQ